MEAQRLLSGFCSPSPIPNARTQYFVRFPSPSPSPSSSSSAASFAQSHRWVSFKARPLSTKLIQCRNTADTERAEVVVSSDKQDLTSGIRRKKLAVFVSGGGSNFRSIHEACLNGLILGDVVVLVASKQGVLNKRRQKLEVVRTSMSQFVQQLEAGASVRIGTEEEAMAVGRLREFVSTSSLCALVLEDADDGVSGMVAEVAREAGFTRVNLDLSPAPHCPCSSSCIVLRKRNDNRRCYFCWPRCVWGSRLGCGIMDSRDIAYSIHGYGHHALQRKYENKECNCCGILNQLYC